MIWWSSKNVAVVVALILFISFDISSFAQSNQPSLTPKNSTPKFQAVSKHFRDVALPPVSFKPTAANPIGFRCRVRLDQHAAPGYVPAEITIDAVGTFAADRDFLIRFQGVADAVAPPRRNLVLDVPVAVTQGSKLTVVTRLLPRWAITREVQIEVIEDGREISGYRAVVTNSSVDNSAIFYNTIQYTPLQYVGAAFSTEVSYDPLMIVDDEVQLQEQEAAIAADFARVTQNLVSVYQRSRLPTDWRAYMSFDSIVITPAMLSKIAEEPRAMAAIRQWLMMGGTMVLVGAEDPRLTMRGLDLSFTQDEYFAAASGVAAGVLTPAWKSNEQILRSYLKHAEQAEKNKVPADWSTVVSYDGEGALAYAPDPRETDSQNVERLEADLATLLAASSRTPDQWNKRIWYQRAAAGRVIGLRQTTSAGGIEIPDLKVVKALIGFRVSPMLRRGVDPMIGDSRFRELLIPGVAQPPVYTFMGLLTAFVVLVGPVAYRQTSRSGRSHLMFAIAPILALLTTGLMFAYGIVSDGFGTSARIRQVTFVDGESQSGVERIRGTYFAGVRPADGLRFGGTDEVMAYPENQGQSWEYQQQFSPQPIGLVTIDQQHQHFDSSFLPSRRQTQFVVHRPRPDLGALKLTLGEDGTATLSNGFDFPLQRVVISDENEKIWLVDQVDAKGTASARTASEKEISQAISMLYTEFRAIMATSQKSKQNRDSNQTYDLVRETMQAVNPETTMMDGVFESDLRDFLQTRAQIPMGYFAAISNVSDDARVVDQVDQFASIRYVFGTYRNDSDDSEISSEGSP